MSTPVRHHARTDTGRVRTHNEDNLLVEPALGLFVVCDGMGGHAAGEVASAMAVEAVRNTVAGESELLAPFDEGQSPTERVETIRGLLEHAVQSANRAVYEESQRDPEKRGMGTTLTAVLLLGRHGFVAHVGDSRAYLLRGGEVRMLTEDHSVMNELRRRGKMRPDQIEKLQMKNALTRAVGVFETVDVDTFHFLVAPGDRFVLCSDGLHGYVSDPSELADVLATRDDEQATERLVVIANERGGHDNITAIVVSVPEEPSEVANDVALGYGTLAAMPFFRFLEPRELLRVHALAKPRYFADGECVVREGDAGDSLFVVVRGRARVHKGDSEIAVLGAGEHFGEMALVENTPRSASVVADGRAEMLEISRLEMFGILRGHPAIGIKLLWNFVSVLSQRLRSTSQALGEAREALQADDVTAMLFVEEVNAPPVVRAPSRRTSAEDARSTAPAIPSRATR